MKRRHLLIGAAGTIAAPAIVRAQAKYPDRTIKLVVPFAPAGPTDIIGRKAAEKLTALLGQTVIVENKAGAAGSIGAVEVKNAKPDGYTFLFAPSSTHAINPTAFVKPAYDAVKDFTPVSSVCVNPLVLVTHPSMPDSVMGLVELMKKIRANIPTPRRATARSFISPPSISSARSAAWKSNISPTRARGRHFRICCRARSPG